MSITTELSVKNALKLLTTKYSNAWNAVLDDPSHALFRGYRQKSSTGIFLVKPQHGNRKSTSNSNYYTILMSQLPSFQNIPPRNSSLICSTSYSFASGYGNVFYVFPENGTELAFSNTHDIWFCVFRPFNNSLLELNEEIENYFNSKNALDSYVEQLKLEKEKNLGTFYKKITELLSPETIGITVTSTKRFYSSTNYNQNSEVWFSNNALMIDSDIVGELVSNYLDLT